MIAGIEGTLESQGNGWAIVKVSGISLRVYVPASTTSHLGTVVGGKIQLQTYLHLREDNITLYGFSTQKELELFKLLIGVDGIGPRIALAMLSAMNSEELALAIASGDVDLLSQLPGIGKKTAHRLVLELKGKLEKSWDGAVTPYLGAENADVVAALTNLGYSTAEALQAVAALPASSDLTLEDKIRLALQHLAQR